MTTCLFCKIVSGDIPTTKIYEDEDFIVIQDLHPITKGHSLLIPKEHSEDILSLDTTKGCKMMQVIQKISKAMMKGLSAQGINITTNCKPAAGQVIMHSHVHLIPRYTNDGLELWKGQDVTEEERLIDAEKIIKAID